MDEEEKWRIRQPVGTEVLLGGVVLAAVGWGTYRAFGRADVTAAVLGAAIVGYVVVLLARRKR